MTHTPTGIDLGCVWLLPPTVTAKYYFAPEASFSPYVGAGVNYTLFYSDNDLRAPILDVDYENRFGFALQAGFDVAISDSMTFNVDVKKLFPVDRGDRARRAGDDRGRDVDIDPWLIGVGIGWRF